MPSRLDEIKARMEKASGEDWFVQHHNPKSPTVQTTEKYQLGADIAKVARDAWDDPHVEFTEEDAAFIAHSRSDIPWLVERAEMLERIRDIAAAYIVAETTGNPVVIQVGMELNAAIKASFDTPDEEGGR